MKKFLGIAVLLAIGNIASAAGKIGDVDISGYLDIYGARNLNNPAAVGISTHVFEGKEGFSFNRAELVLENPSFRADLGFGLADDVVNATGVTNVTSMMNIQQLFVKAPVGKSLVVTAGKFVTHMGMEVIESKDNWLYSRGLLFQYAIPYYHTGVKAAYAINDSWNGHLALVNGWNTVIAPDRNAALCGQLMGTPVKGMSVYINGITGSHVLAGSQANVIDLVAMYDVSSSLSLGANYDNGSVRTGPAAATNSYSAWALYAKYLLMSNGTNLVVRYENFSDPSTAIVGLVGATNVSSITVGLNDPLDSSSTLRTEYRMDLANAGTPFSSSTGAKNTQSSVTIGWVTTF